MVLKEKIIITMLATGTAVIFIALTYIFPNLARMFLTIEVVILPSIYLVGSQIVEAKLRKQYESVIAETEEQTRRLNHKLYMLQNLNNTK